MFQAAEKRGMALVAGQVLGDKNLPTSLQQDPTVAIAETESLIKRWHHKPGTRLEYALTLRFAPTTSLQLFKQAESLLSKYPDIYFHTHVSENAKDVAWVKQLFPQESYAGVYDKYHLLQRRSILAHRVWLQDTEMALLQQRGSSIAFCPTSNLFLGSGLFNLAKADAQHLKIGLGTDIGAGTSLSLLQTLGEAYKVLQLQQQELSGLRGFYFLTLGAATALDLQQSIGSIKPGKYADLVVLDMHGATTLLQRRLRSTTKFEDKIFALMTLGDDRSILATYVQGKRLYWRG